MTHTLKRTFAMLFLAVFGSAILYNCEPDPDSLGEQLFDKDAAVGVETPYNVIAYNISNNDSIRSDASRLIAGLNASGTSVSVGVLGSFTEGQFGTQKASYITQLRMPVDNFDFSGPNAKVDSVVLVVRPPANTMDDTYYIADSIKAPGAYDRSDFPVGNETVAVSIDKKTYPVRKYGNISKSMTINVHEVTTFIDTNNDAFTRSNASVVTGDLLGSAVFDGNMSTVTVTKKSDNTNLFTGNLGFRMKLDNNFFQTRIIDKKGKPELQDASNFIRYFRGIQLSVSETNKYLFQFSPNDLEIIMYYKYDKTENGTTTHPQTTLKFNLGSANAHIGKYEYTRPSSFTTIVNGANKEIGDQKLYVQGMGGPSVGIKISKETLDKMRKELYDQKKAIVGAKIRVYVDPLTFENKHSVEGDRKFTLVPPMKIVDGVKQYPFTSDLASGLPMYYYYKKTSGKPEYYDLTVTKTLKDITEAKAFSAEDLILKLDLGSFVKNSQGTPAGAQYTTRATDMNRAVLVGNDNSTQKIQLFVTYGTKK
ncbi:DUF4270 family protein [Chryseobacterium artocarpi]|nr:DUF4270 family protein [Chryseobacterium artocarpi]